VSNEPIDPNDPPPPASEGRDGRNSSEGFEPLPEAIKGILRRAGFETSDPKVVKILLEASLTKIQGSLDFPPAHILRGWEEVFPGITAKLVEWRERQTSHRHRMEKLQTERAEKRADDGQFIAAILALFGLTCATILGLNNHPVVAFFMMVLSIGGPAAAIILAKNASPPRVPGSD
jgi:uncharacterized membrane protein